MNEQSVRLRGGSILVVRPVLRVRRGVWPVSRLNVGPLFGGASRVALRKRGKFWYGDSQADICGELIRYGKLDDEVPTQFKDVRCTCGSTTFRLQMDEEQGAAVRTCTSCGTAHAIGDSDEYLKVANLEPRGCVCGGDVFEITIGVSLYDGSNDARWLYVGCRCPVCGMLGNYGDWTSEFPDYTKLLKRA